jgi:hypothetical protein
METWQSRRYTRQEERMGFGKFTNQQIHTSWPLPSCITLERLADHLSFNCLYIYSYVHTLFGPSLPSQPSRTSVSSTVKKGIMFSILPDYYKDKR